MFERAKKWIAESWGFSYQVKDAAARDPKKTGLKKVGQALKGSGASEFEESTIDLAQISAAYKTDSYIRKAVDKYADLMFKMGWDISAKDDTVSEYVWLRLKFMSEQTGQPLQEFFKEIAFNIVLYGNAFVVKQRTGNPPQGVKMTGYSSTKPVLGYFVLPSATINISRDATGKILKYQQDTGSGSAIDIKAEDMIHFYYGKDTGRAFGTPFIHNALDDVKLLRQIEENVARLIYRNLFPLYQYQVGIDKPGYEATDEEIEEIRDQIREMPMDGGVVVPERHNISVVSNSGAALDVDPYLKYFRQRVFTGLGVSDIVMGIGDTANRGTADNLSSEMIDGVKEFQMIFKMIFESKIINELLFEGGYDPIVNTEHEVEFIFHEIELDAKIKNENHIVQMFVQNAISHEEMRMLLGLDPVADESRLYFNLVTIPIAVQTAQASAAVSNAASDSTTAANNAGSNKDQPANQNGKQSSPGGAKTSKDAANTRQLEQFSSNILTESSIRVNLHSELGISSYTEGLKKVWRSFREDALMMTQGNRSKDHIKAFGVELAKQQITFVTSKYITDAFMKGVHEASIELGVQAPNILGRLEARNLVDKAKFYTDRLMNDMEKFIDIAIDREDTAAYINGAFNSNEYRLSFTSANELFRAYNYGRAILAKSHGIAEGIMHLHEEKCEVCTEKAKQPIQLNDPNLLDAVPPHHPNCTCTIDFVQPNEGGVN